jgi:predicted phosphodiesterase
MWAILSDIHSNFEAFRAVMDDIDQLDVDRVIILGDIVNYGPQPIECIDMARFFGNVVLLGDHDQDIMFDPGGFRQPSEELIRMIERTRKSLEADEKEREARWDFLASLKRSHKEGPFLFVHASPRNPVNEYLFPEDIYNQRKMDRVFALTDQYCFNGHTHVSGIIVEDGPNKDYRFLPPPEVDMVYRLDQRKAIINVGSVGQPRDQDPRACYVLFDGETVFYRRVSYDIEAVKRLL